MYGIKLQDRFPSKEITWRNLGTTAKQVAMVWACAVKQESLANAKVNARQHCVVWSH